MRAVVILVFAALAIAHVVGVVAAADASVECPRVFDGFALGDYDLQIQESTSTIVAHWSGLEESQVLGFEWALVSDKIAATNFDTQCRRDPGFIGSPDVVDWTFIRKDMSVVHTRLQLQQDTRYHVVLRTTLSNGAQVYSNSNGVRVVPPVATKESSSTTTTTTTTTTISSSRFARSTLSAEEIAAVSANERAVRATLAAPLPAEQCPIDAANRCRQSQKSPGELLREIYGPPQFSGSSQISTLFRIPTTVFDAVNIGLDPAFSREEREARGLAFDEDPFAQNQSSSSSDDDDDSVIPGVAVAGIVAPISAGTILLMLLIALIAWLLASSGSRDVYRSDARVASPPRASASAAAPPAAAPAGGDTVRMDFPDLDVRA